MLLHVLSVSEAGGGHIYRSLHGIVAARPSLHMGIAVRVLLYESRLTDPELPQTHGDIRPQKGRTLERLDYLSTW